MLHDAANCDRAPWHASSSTAPAMHASASIRGPLPHHSRTDTPHTATQPPLPIIAPCVAATVLLRHCSHVTIPPELHPTATAPGVCAPPRCGPVCLTFPKRSCNQPQRHGNPTPQQPTSCTPSCIPCYSDLPQSMHTPPCNAHRPSSALHVSLAALPVERNEALPDGA